MGEYWVNQEVGKKLAGKRKIVQLQISAFFLFSNFRKRQIALYDSIATVGEIRVYWRADFQSGSRVLKKVF